MKWQGRDNSYTTKREREKERRRNSSSIRGTMTAHWFLQFSLFLKVRSFYNNTVAPSAIMQLQDEEKLPHNSALAWGD